MIDFFTEEASTGLFTPLWYSTNLICIFSHKKDSDTKLHKAEMHGDQSVSLTKMSSAQQWYLYQCWPVYRSSKVLALSAFQTVPTGWATPCGAPSFPLCGTGSISAQTLSFLSWHPPSPVAGRRHKRSVQPGMSHTQTSNIWSKWKYTTQIFTCNSSQESKNYSRTSRLFMHKLWNVDQDVLGTKTCKTTTTKKTSLKKTN